MKSGKLFETALLLLLIFSCAILFNMVAEAGSSEQEHWNVRLNASPYMYVGDHDRLYVFDDREVYAINPDCSLAWEYSVPDNWSVISRWQRDKAILVEDGSITSTADRLAYPVFTDSDDTLYLYVYQDPYEIILHHDNRTGQYSEEYKTRNLTADKLLAIRGGRVLWEQAFPIDKAVYGAVGMARTDGLSLDRVNDRLYLFRQNNVTVIALNGTVLFEIPQVSDPPAIDEQGRIYVVEAIKPERLEDYPQFSPWRSMPSNTVKAYNPNGSLLWSRTADGEIIRPEIKYVASTTPEMWDFMPIRQPESLSVPISENGRVVVPLLDGAQMLDQDGEVVWTLHLDRKTTPIEGTPYDSDGNLYLAETEESFLQHYYTSPKLVYIVAPDGSYTIGNMMNANKSCWTLGASGGRAFFSNGTGNNNTMPDLGILLPMNVTARDLRTGNDLWTFRVPAEQTATVTVTEDNIKGLLIDDWAIEKSIYYNRDHPYLQYEPNLKYGVFGEQIVNVLPAGDLVYVSYYAFNYEYPVLPEGQGYMAGTANPGMIITPKYMGPSWGYPYVATFNKSKLVYASGICALDRNGTLLWQKPTGSFVTGMAANNSTIYYGTKGGGVSGLGLAAGITATAAALIVLRFLAVGAVSRARSRLDQNENRLAIVKQVQESPGSTMYEIARTLDMNLGTMRYHLLILGLNHKVREHRDGKYVRYFPGSQALTPEELEILSLLRREPVRRLMGMLLEKPGVSNAEIARALGISESAVSNYMRDLSARGYVTKEVTAAGRVRYQIRKEHAEKIEKVLAPPG